MHSSPLMFASIDIPDAISVKDPCPVFDGEQWHLFTSYGSHQGEAWQCMHFTARQMTGPYELRRILQIDLPGGGIAAPGVVFDEGGFHLFVQTEYLRPGGLIGYMNSKDGFNWSAPATVMRSVPDTDHAGIYDPHPSVVGGRKVLVYSALNLTLGKPPQPDIYWATAQEWAGPWQPMGALLTHEDVPFHNPRNHPDYEWGLEGAQLLELPGGRLLLTFVAFLSQGRRGTRQRLCHALSDGLGQPFRPLEPMITPPAEGENGHGVTLMQDGQLVTFFQQQSPGMKWRPAFTTDPLLSATILDGANEARDRAA